MSEIRENIRKAIKILDENTANRIAAGEVVERPASIVKELVENALDAGSTAVTVDIIGGGIEQIRVTDNGSGIPAADVRLAFERHATSKIASGDRLTDIGTLGFRGEALPSIAAVSKVTLTTKTKNDEIGVRISVEGGAVMDISQAGCPQGTTIIVKDLFYNTPARRKFLKRPQTEGGIINDMLASLALSRPEISIRFSMGAKTVFQTPGDGNLQSALYTVFGQSTAKDMMPVEGNSGYVKVGGYVGGGALARGNRQNEIFFVNGRTVRSTPLSQGLEAAMKERVMIGRFPICALNIIVPPEMVDVNCHPSKTEVRFSDEAYVRQAVYDVVFESVTEQFNLKNAAAAFIPERAPQEKPQVFDFSQTTQQKTEVPEMDSVDLGIKPPAKPMMLRDSAYSMPHAQPQGFPGMMEFPRTEAAKELSQEEIKEPGAVLPHYDIIGQVFSTYLLLRSGERLLIIDQHAAHERLRYDELMRRFEGGVYSQKLLVARIFDVTISDKAKIMDNIGALSKAGFEVDEFGVSTVRVSAVPVILGEPSISGFFSEFVDRLGELSSIREPERKRERIIQMACKSAIKAGDSLAREEIEALLKTLFESGSPPHCPHGRPIIIEITKRELERRFGRIV
ncbi:MAG: DNA mismatch repair endonuclease MutL [Christensenellales bacterium]|jgi:DNA mismatch repair protein MutL